MSLSDVELDMIARCRVLNDRLRTEGKGGEIEIVESLAHADEDLQNRVMKAVRESQPADFGGDDTYDERNHGYVEIDGENYCWTIYYYDHTLEEPSENPGDETVTKRIMTVLHISDY